MRNNDNIIFVDYKGVSHNARVQSFREHRNAQGALLHDEPLVTLNYNAPPNGEPLTLIDVPHISHPSRKDNNPDLPSYPLHAWKREDEEHLELPEDHPVHDHFNEQPKRDDEGNIVPKQRPQYEAHIQQHRATKGFETEFTTTGVLTPKSIPVPVGGDLPVGSGPRPPAGSAAEAALNAAVSVGHPAHPGTVKFMFECDSCGASVTRTASHHGGKQWEPKPGAQAKGAVLGGDNSDLWQEHVCSQSDIDAFRKKIEDAKKPAVVEPSASERLATGEQLAPEIAKPEPEVDVISELEKATPAPSETENKPEDAA